jgi:ParB family chromosome partitioning protein
LEEIQRPLEVIETEINFYKNQTATGIIEIGKRLIEAKAQLPHGEWGKWLEEKAEMSQWTANKMMRVAKELSNCGTLNNLTQTKVFMLLDVPEDRREKFVHENKVDDMTTRELQKAIKQTKELEQEKEHLERQLQAEKDKPAKVIKERVEVPPHDYESLKVSTRIKQKEINELKEKLDRFQKDSEEYNRLKEQIEFLHKEKDDLGRRIESATELSGLAVKIDNFLKTELAPIRYSRCFERMDSEVARDNLLEIIESVETWCYEIKQLIPEEYRRVTVIK